METKDWMLLFIPIVFNGFILWLFQMLITKMMRQKELVDDMRRSVYNRYFELVTNTCNASRNLYKLIANMKEEGESEQLTQFNEQIKELKDHIMTLYFFYVDYKVILILKKQINQDYTELMRRFREWSRHTHTASSTTEFLIDCEKLLHNVMDTTLSAFFNIRKNV